MQTDCDIEVPEGTIMVRVMLNLTESRLYTVAPMGAIEDWVLDLVDSGVLTDRMQTLLVFPKKSSRLVNPDIIGYQIQFGTNFGDHPQFFVRGEVTDVFLVEIPVTTGEFFVRDSRDLPGSEDSTFASARGSSRRGSTFGESDASRPPSLTERGSGAAPRWSVGYGSPPSRLPSRGRESGMTSMPSERARATSPLSSYEGTSSLLSSGREGPPPSFTDSPDKFADVLEARRRAVHGSEPEERTRLGSAATRRLLHDETKFEVGNRRTAIAGSVRGSSPRPSGVSDKDRSPLAGLLDKTLPRSSGPPSSGRKSWEDDGEPARGSLANMDSWFD